GTDEIRTRCQWVVRAALQPHPGGCLGLPQGRQQGLQYQRRRAGTADGEVILTGLYRTRHEPQRGRAQRRTFNLRITDLCRGVDGSQMLAHQPWTRTRGADVIHVAADAGAQAQGKRRPQQLPPALRSINFDHFHGLAFLWRPSVWYGDAYVVLSLHTY